MSSCSFSNKNGGTLSIRYFADHPQFGVDEQKIDDVIINKLFNSSHNFPITSRNLEIALENLQQKIQRRSDYGKDICCLFILGTRSVEEKPSTAVYICGTKNIVQQIHQEIKNVTDEHTPVSCTTQLTADQVCTFKICTNTNSYSLLFRINLSVELQNKMILIIQEIFSIL